MSQLRENIYQDPILSKLSELAKGKEYSPFFGWRLSPRPLARDTQEGLRFLVAERRLFIHRYH